MGLVKNISFLEMGLADKKWQELKGGYKIPYDVSIPLSQLEESHILGTISKIFEELAKTLRG